MYEMILGEKNEDDFEDNLFYITKKGVSRLTYFLKPVPEYEEKTCLEIFNLPPEIWEKIFDLVVYDFTAEFNYKLLAQLLQVSRPYMVRFYMQFFGRDMLINQEISDIERYYRISQTLYTLERLVTHIYTNFTNRFELRVDNQFNQFPNPWDIFAVTPTIPIRAPKVYNHEKKSLFRPETYQIGPCTAFIKGSKFKAALRATYIRLPTIVLRVTRSRNLTITLTFLKYSHSWNVFNIFLSKGFGPTIGIYHSISLPSLPDEFIFEDEVLVES